MKKLISVFIISIILLTSMPMTSYAKTIDLTKWNGTPETLIGQKDSRNFIITFNKDIGQTPYQMKYYIKIGGDESLPYQPYVDKVIINGNKCIMHVTQLIDGKGYGIYIPQQLLAKDGSRTKDDYQLYFIYKNDIQMTLSK